MMLTQSGVLGFIQAAYPLLASAPAFYCGNKILSQYRENDDEKAWVAVMALEFAWRGGFVWVIAKTAPAILQFWFGRLPL